MTNYNDGKWHGWNGGECPVHPESEVECRLREAGRGYDGRIRKAGDWGWGHSIYDPGACIIAFRVTKEHKEPRRIWVIEHPDRLEVVHYDSEKSARSYAGPSAIRIVEFVEVLK